MASRRNNRAATSKLALSAMLLAMMLILGYVEAMIPLNVGIPGVKLGLSNGVLIFAVYMLDIPTAFILMTLKVTLSSLMFSGVSAMMYGLCGGLVSLTGMVLLSMGRRLPVPVVSVAGGILHNAGQIALSLIILNLPVKAMMVYLLWLTAIGALCGFLTGVCARLVMKHMRSAGFAKQTGHLGSNGTIVLACAAVLAAVIMSYAFMPKAAPSDPVDPTPVFEDGGHALILPLP